MNFEVWKKVIKRERHNFRQIIETAKSITITAVWWSTVMSILRCPHGNLRSFFTSSQIRIWVKFDFKLEFQVQIRFKGIKSNSWSLNSSFYDQHSILRHWLCVTDSSRVARIKLVGAIELILWKTISLSFFHSCFLYLFSLFI